MGILNRTIYYDDSDGYIRWMDWATVTTTIGAAVEPFLVQRIGVGADPGDLANYEFDDQIARVDSIERIDSHKFARILSGGIDNPPVQGGNCLPRVGK